ncbi:MAG: hypothetical protein WC227_03530 [Patescibacteria group bacterium]|jgi:hypothetical protein
MTRKIFSFIVGFLAFIVLLLFFLALNFKIALSDPGKISRYIKNSGASELIISYIKENLVATNNVSLSEGTNLEIVNESITTELINPLIDEAVLRTSLALNDPSPENLKFDLTYDTSNQTVFPTSTVFTKTVDLRNNQYFLILANLNLYLYILGGASLALILITLLILKDTQDRIAFAGRFLVVLSLAIALVYLALVYLAPSYVRNAFSLTGFASDARLANAMKKIWIFSVEKQFALYFAEFLVFFVSGGVLGYLGGMFRRLPLGEKMEIKI